MPTMITSRSDSIHSRRASMCHNAAVLPSIFLLQHGHKCYSIPQNTGFFATVTLPNMLKTLKAKTAVISTIFLLQHGHNAILSHKTQGFRILSQARLARANAMTARFITTITIMLSTIKYYYCYSYCCMFGSEDLLSE